jgi:hypothetical protein
MKKALVGLLGAGTLFASACTTQQAWVNDVVMGLFDRIDRLDGLLEDLVTQLNSV